MLEMLSNPFVDALLVVVFIFIIRHNRATLNNITNKTSKRRKENNEVKLPSFSTIINALVTPGDPTPQVGISADRFLEMALAENGIVTEKRESPAAPVQAKDTPKPAAPVYPIAQDAKAWLSSALNAQTINLSEVAKADNILVAGPKGSGKTTVLRTILTARKNEEIIALDPHASPGKWPCVVVGAGLEWNQIGQALRKMVADMRHRFGQLAHGEIKEGEFPRRSYVGDEFLSIVQELDGKEGRENAGKALIGRITQGRKVGECILIASQNDTVEALGIKGNSDLKGCFDYIIFLGSLVGTRADWHGCPKEVMADALRKERPAVVWNTNNNTWFILNYDMKLVLEGEALSNVSVGHTDIPVRENSAKNPVIPGGMNHTGMGGMAGIPHQEAIPQHTDIPAHTADELLMRAIKVLQSHPDEFSQNELIAFTGVWGDKAKRIERVKSLVGLAEAQNASAA